MLLDTQTKEQAILQLRKVFQDWRTKETLREIIRDKKSGVLDRDMKEISALLKEGYIEREIIELCKSIEKSLFEFMGESVVSLYKYFKEGKIIKDEYRRRMNGVEEGIKEMGENVNEYTYQRNS